MIKKNEAKCGGSVISYKVTRKVLPDEVILSRDLKEVREEGVQITEGRKFQTMGTVSTELPSSPVLAGTSGKDAGVRGGKVMGFYDHLLTQTYAEHLLGAAGPGEKHREAIPAFKEVTSPLATRDTET